MKTNVVMIRNMGNFQVTQRTKDGMFNAGDLLYQWNKHISSKKRRMSEFLNSPKTEEFKETIIADIISNNGNIEKPESQVVRIVKGKTSKKGVKSNDDVWMHPYLFIDFAMWINPKFKVQVIKFVYDQLIKNRHSAGDNYKMLSESGAKLKGYNFQEVAKAMNWIVFKKHNKNLRQIATPEQLKELSDLQTKLSFAIDMGYIKSYKQLMKEMRLIWSTKQLMENQLV